MAALLFAILLTLVAGLPRTFPNQLAPEDGLIEAGVKKGALMIYTVNKDGEPIAGVSVRLSRASSYSVASTTSSFGRACWLSLPSGNYTLYIQAPMGYVTASTTHTIVFDASSSKNTCANPAKNDTFVLGFEDAYVKLQYTDPPPCSGSESADQQLAKFAIQRLGEETQTIATTPLNDAVCVKLSAQNSYTIQQIQAPCGGAIDSRVRNLDFVDGNSCSDAPLLEFTTLTTASAPCTVVLTVYSIWQTANSASQQLLAGGKYRFVDRNNKALGPDFVFGNQPFCQTIVVGDFKVVEVTQPQGTYRQQPNFSTWYNCPKITSGCTSSTCGKAVNLAYFQA